MRTKFFAFLLTGMLGATLLSGCADDWDEELTEEVSAEYEKKHRVWKLEGWRSGQ